jgi:hypothetical protein
MEKKRENKYSKNFQVKSVYVGQNGAGCILEVKNTMHFYVADFLCACTHFTTRNDRIHNVRKIINGNILLQLLFSCLT